MPFLMYVLSACAIIVAGCTHAPDRLAMHDDGTFTIVQFTDTHLNEADGRDEPTYDLMRLVIERDRPDLIALTGDIGRLYPPDSTSEHAEIAKQTWPRLIAFLDSTGIPWAFAHGNHDAELTTRNELDSMVLTSRTTLYDPGPTDVTGHGNYALPIYRRDGEVGAIAWFFDSDAWRSKGGGYGHVGRDQIEWFEAESRKLQAGQNIPGLAFFHIPPIQYRAAWDSCECLGTKQEKVCNQGEDAGFVDALRRNGVVGTFCGHDHVNDYSCDYHGITLAYGRGTGYRAYGRDGFQRGARVIVLTDEGRAWESYIRLADGTIAEQPRHAPELVAD